MALYCGKHSITTPDGTHCPKCQDELLKNPDTTITVVMQPVKEMSKTVTNAMIMRTINELENLKIYDLNDEIFYRLTKVFYDLLLKKMELPEVKTKDPIREILDLDDEEVGI